jgi:hypothetical protein
MIARLSHRPMLMAWALATVLAVVLLTVMVFAAAQLAVSPPSISGGGNPAAHAQSGGGVGSGADLIEQHAQMVAANNK